MHWIDVVTRGWAALAALLVILLSFIAGGHALLYKRDSRSVVLWVGFVWLVPFFGALLYFIFGINRIKRRAILLRGNLARFRSAPSGTSHPGSEMAGYLPADAHHLTAVAEVVDKVVDRRLLGGNRIEPLVDGDRAYPEMLRAIAEARHSVTLATYIFDRDETGLSFAAALGEAVRRGVEVRVLIDATGTRYSLPTILGALRKEGVRYARFLRTFPPWQMLSLNLRNHRKLLVVDGRVGFTGGMNIRVGHHLSLQPRYPVQDVQFRVEGPVVAHLQEAFADDWFFTTRESLRGTEWFPPLEPAGTVIARGIADGPDEGFEKLRWTLLAAISSARRSISILTPYFLPEPAIVSALNVAAMRGVAVHIVLPAKGNLPFAQWASTAQWWQVLIHGCRIWLTPPPFDHSKLFIVDDCWSSVGSTNWDPRSLRLNFEFNLECYDRELASVLGELFERKRARAREVTLREVDGRSVPVRLRDGVARLLTPFL
jgi:cardiolipin synthase